MTQQRPSAAQDGAAPVERVQELLERRYGGAYTHTRPDKHGFIMCPVCERASARVTDAGTVVCPEGCDIAAALGDDGRGIAAVASLPAAKGRAGRRSLLPSEPPPVGSSHEQLAGWLTVALGQGADQVAGVELYGRHVDARAVLVTRGGRRVTFDRIGDLFDPAKLIQVVMTATGAQVPPYGRADVLHLAGSILRLGELLVEDDARGEAIEWGRTFLDGAAANAVTATDFSSPGGRWEALSILDRRLATEPLPHAQPCERARLAIDGATGARMVRTSEFAAHARSIAGRPLSWNGLHGRMVEVGWEHRAELQQRRPGGQTDEKLKCRVYVIPAGWEHE